MSENTIYDKSKRFAVRIVNLYRYIKEDKKEYVMSKQLLRCGTSIGANVAESGCAISEKDFLSKLYVAFKECAETQYWLDILFETSFLSEQEYQSISRDCSELKKLLSSITKTTREKMTDEETK
ncbi:MAG: four helix bundle protein [Ruminococcus sp.]|nr:four helix bundle protein [Ruminococcus sp.]